MTFSSAFATLPLEEQAEALLPALRLYGSDSSSESIRSLVNDITASLDAPPISRHLLTTSIRILFTQSPHPMLHPTTSRALPRPAGGPDAYLDAPDKPPWKQSDGCCNVIKWCCSVLSEDQIEANIGLVLPPTLTMMDDWDPVWRGRGAQVLASWYQKFSPETMRRMGIDRLLLKSLIHTLSLHANPPLKGVIELTIRLVERTTKDEERAHRMEEIVDTIIKGWTYAPSGNDGKPVLIDLAQNVTVVCDAFGEGVVRWIKVSPSSSPRSHIDHYPISSRTAAVHPDGL